MARMSAREIGRHLDDDYTEQDADIECELRFEEPDHDCCIEPEYDYAADDWIFDDEWFDD